jgi:zinc-binding alcohol dehydrogenase family protein
MKAVALTRYLPVADPEALIDVELPDPIPGPRDLLVRVKAISVNPIDTKVRAPKDKLETRPKVLGWDAAGVVEQVGETVRRFRPGDEVYYAGSITRPGCNSELHLVDERIVGGKPTRLSFAEAAALPLTTITAWEALFERLGIDVQGEQAGQSLLLIGGGGGVGSIGIQLANLAGLTVIATASRPETRALVEKLGADHVLDHRQPLSTGLRQLGFVAVDYIANFVDTDSYWNPMAELIRPEGRIVSIVDNVHPVALNLLKSKSVTFVWESMFTKSMFETPNMSNQGKLLDEVALLVDSGTIQSTVTEVLEPIHAANLREAHRRIESHKTIGKIVLAGW